ncbi:hypothetical protein MMC22_007796 [Lobaria immixta]|nr:hypothetical protein [Lobaria immixta]
MSYTLTVPIEYGYVVMTAALSTFLGTWHGLQTAKFRKAAKVRYPNAYSTDSEAKEDKAKYLFNCAQRAHTNFMEHQPGFLASLLLAGLSYPIASAAMGLAWCVGRVTYGLGYTNKNKTDGSGRIIGNFYVLPELGLFLTAALTGWKILKG